MVLYEDEQLLVCIKPRGILSCKDASGNPSVEDLLAPRTVFPLHRLDKEVCGLMVFAKTKAAAAHLSKVEGFCKEYQAICEGQPPEQGDWTDLLYHDRFKNKTYVVNRKRNGVKEARLTYTLMERGEESLVAVRLYTGRTHQIRVQFASRGYPLRGDRKYGAKSTGAIALCACRLSFSHPDGRTLEFTTAPDWDRD
jgi:23S rRNA pseudouridine1911/1915/1917 synthase